MQNIKDSWRILEEHIYEKFRIFTAKRSRRVNPRTGKSFDFFLMEGLDWVNIIPVTPSGNVVLVRQYRHGSESYTLETPGGTVEPDEDHKATALRELLEETGYSAGGAQYLGTLYPNPAMQAMRIHYYYAPNTVKTGEQQLDPGEDIQVVEFPLTKMSEMIANGEITSALVVAAFEMLKIKQG